MSGIVKPTMEQLLQKVWIKPDPLQPGDTNDEMIDVAVTLDGLCLLYAGFQCAKCHEKYLREVFSMNLMSVEWTPSLHVCMLTEAEQG